MTWSLARPLLFLVSRDLNLVVNTHCVVYPSIDVDIPTPDYSLSSTRHFHQTLPLSILDTAQGCSLSPTPRSIDLLTPLDGPFQPPLDVLLRPFFFYRAFHHQNVPSLSVSCLRVRLVPDEQQPGGLATSIEPLHSKPLF